MNRLSAYYTWNDPQNLKQPLLVTTKHNIELDEIRA